MMTGDPATDWRLFIVAVVGFVVFALFIATLASVNTRTERDERPEPNRWHRFLNDIESDT